MVHVRDRRTLQGGLLGNRSCLVWFQVACVFIGEVVDDVEALQVRLVIWRVPIGVEGVSDTRLGGEEVAC